MIASAASGATVSQSVRLVSVIARGCGQPTRRTASRCAVVGSEDRDADAGRIADQPPLGLHGRVAPAELGVALHRDQAGAARRVAHRGLALEGQLEVAPSLGDVGGVPDDRVVDLQCRSLPVDEGDDGAAPEGIGHEPGEPPHQVVAVDHARELFGQLHQTSGAPSTDDLGSDVLDDGADAQRFAGEAHDREVARLPMPFLPGAGDLERELPPPDRPTVAVDLLDASAEQMIQAGPELPVPTADQPAGGTSIDLGEPAVDLVELHVGIEHRNAHGRGLEQGIADLALAPGGAAAVVDPAHEHEHPGCGQHEHEQRHRPDPRVLGILLGEEEPDPDATRRGGGEACRGTPDRRPPR